MDCATLCLLAVSVGLMPSPQNQRCTYCMDVRGITSICEEDPLKCVQFDPDSLIYCLTVNEFLYSGNVRRVVRCLSHKHFNMSSDSLTQALSTNECLFENMQSCGCPTCSLPTTTAWTTAKALPSSGEFDEDPNFSGEVGRANMQDVSDDDQGNLRLPSSYGQMRGHASDQIRYSSAPKCFSFPYFLFNWIIILLLNYLIL